MKNQALFSSKDKSTKLKCRLLQFLFGALRVNSNCYKYITLTDLQHQKHQLPPGLILYFDLNHSS